MIEARYVNELFEASFASWPMVVLFVVGTAFVVFLLSHFLKEERYRHPPKPEKGVEFVAARRAVEVRISALAPKVMLLAEKEKSVAARLQEGSLGEEARETAERLLREAASGRFWEKFVEASALVEIDPVRAHEELDRLLLMAETALEKLGRAEKIACGGEDAGTPECG